MRAAPGWPRGAAERVAGVRDARALHAGCERGRARRVIRRPLPSFLPFFPPSPPLHFPLGDSGARLPQFSAFRSTARGRTVRVAQKLTREKGRDGTRVGGSCYSRPLLLTPLPSSVLQGSGDEGGRVGEPRPPAMDVRILAKSARRIFPPLFAFPQEHRS